MKAIIARTMFTIGAALVILSAFYVIIGKEDISVHTILQIFGACILINFGIHLRFKFEIRYFILEFIIDVSYIILVLCVFGAIFDWFSSVSVWYLAVMAVVIYILVIVTTVYKIHKDTKEINDLLQKRREKT